MKRKIVGQGNNSLTVTIPIDWARAKGLSDGSEIDVMPSGEYLILGSENSVRKVISLDIGKASTSVRKLISTLYRNGYDEIELKYKESVVADCVSNTVWRELVGFEVVKIKDGCLQIKDIAHLDPDSFPMLFKKNFLLILTILEDGLHQLRTRNREGMRNLFTQDSEINKTTNLCQRLLNKKMNDRRKIAVLTYVLKAMENFGDDFNDMLHYCLNKDKYPTPSTLKILEDIIYWFREAYNQYYKFDLESCLLSVEQIYQLRLSLAQGSTTGNIFQFLRGMCKKAGLIMEGSLVMNIEGRTLKKEDWIS
jgi:phosphate uptake regulator